MRILAVTNHYPPFHGGGYGALCHRLCEGLRERGHDVEVLTAAPESTAAHPGGHRLVASVRRELRFTKGCSGARLLCRTLHNHRCVRRAIARFHPDLVYGFSVDGVGYEVHHVAAESGVPYVTLAGDTWLAQAWRDLPRFDAWHALVRGGDDEGPRGMAKRMMALLGRAMGLYTGCRPAGAHPVHAISTYLLDDLRAAGMPMDERSRLIGCPLDDAFTDDQGYPVGRNGARDTALRALFVSRMELLKGPDTAMEAVAAAVRAGADVTLTLAGIGAEAMRPMLMEAAATLGIADRITWAHAADAASLRQLYQGHDVFLFPTRIVEGFGIVCLEAMACGLPVLASRSGGQVDLVKDGENGFLHEPADAAALAAHLGTLAHDRALVEKLSSGAVKAACRYRAPQIFDAIEASFRELVA